MKMAYLSVRAADVERAAVALQQAGIQTAPGAPSSAIGWIAAVIGWGLVVLIAVVSNGVPDFVALTGLGLCLVGVALSKRPASTEWADRPRREPTL